MESAGDPDPGALLPPPPRVVTVGEFRATACNRCGMCCEEIDAPLPPDGIATLAGDPTTQSDRRRWLLSLEPVRQTPDGWRYRCMHASRDAAGLSVCAIYDDRPAVCRGFPFGEPVAGWPQCAWYVTVLDTDGRSPDRG